MLVLVECQKLAWRKNRYSPAQIGWKMNLVSRDKTYHVYSKSYFQEWFIVKIRE